MKTLVIVFCQNKADADTALGIVKDPKGYNYPNSWIEPSLPPDATPLTAGVIVLIMIFVGGKIIDRNPQNLPAGFSPPFWTVMAISP